MCREANGVIAADCECPVGYGGDAYLRCQNLNDKIGQDCVMDEECGSSLRCETGATFRKCVDPCTKLKCSENLECAVRDHLPTCVCQSGLWRNKIFQKKNLSHFFHSCGHSIQKIGYTGNPNIGCTKDVEFNVTAVKENPCGGLSCGPHSECRFVNGQPTCSCRSYARGEPPSCYQECRANSDCELGLSCIQKQCRHSCERCGNNTKCLISRNPRQESVCTCLEG